jgi:hypothetical protein
MTDHQVMIRMSDGTAYGPISHAELQRWHAEGRIPPDAIISDLGTGESHTTVRYFSKPASRFAMRTADGHVYGPVSRTELAAWYTEGRIPPDATIVDADTGTVYPLVDAMALCGVTVVPAAPEPPAPVVAPPEPQRASHPIAPLLVIALALSIIAAVVVGIVSAQQRQAVGYTRTCLSEQHRLAMAALMYVEDHESTFPSIDTLWSELAFNGRCPAVNTGDGYGFNSALNELSSSTITSPDTTLLLADARGASHLIATEADLDGTRHRTNVDGERAAGGCIITTLDGASRYVAFTGTQAVLPASVHLNVMVTEPTLPEATPPEPEMTPPVVPGETPDGSDMVRVPNVVGIDRTTAEQQLAAAGLRVEALAIASSAFPAGQVFSTRPEAGTRVKRGTTVRLLVAAAQSGHPTPPRVTPPSATAVNGLKDYAGQDADAAMTEMRALGLSPYRENVEDQHQPKGTVVRTEPGPGARISTGLRVRVTVAK